MHSLIISTKSTHSNGTKNCIKIAMVVSDHIKHDDVNIVQDDPTLPDDGGKVPKPNGMVASLIPGCDMLVYLA